MSKFEAKLDRIIALLETVCELLDPGTECQDPDDGTCQHPEDSRIDCRTMGGGEEWICSLCGFYYSEREEDNT